MAAGLRAIPRYEAAPSRAVAARPAPLPHRPHRVPWSHVRTFFPTTSTSSLGWTWLGAASESEKLREPNIQGAANLDTHGSRSCPLPRRRPARRRCTRTHDWPHQSNPKSIASGIGMLLVGGGIAGSARVSPVTLPSQADCFGDRAVASMSLRVVASRARAGVGI